MTLKESLSPRQFQVAGLIRDGLSNKEIAARIGVTPHVVKNYVGLIFDAVECHSRTQVAVRYERENPVEI
jgi:DNA-binding NarL/FixJ family response regulator